MEIISASLSSGSDNGLGGAMKSAESGLRAQAFRMRIIAENLANQNSVSSTPGGDPYRRRIPTIENSIDPETGASLARGGEVALDQSQFQSRYEPGHPSADVRGYIKVPNISGLIEAADMRSAQRSYEANINVVEATRAMMTRTIDLLR